ncbi:unnamed protein product [Linum tenue]|uniref:Uncharacterized protein n=1 Tax=Linum tenue TaxID=586396 RepID=A0AAV0Q9D3_9ROSI|nr:unnamed protein product [Linum tenue]
MGMFVVAPYHHHHSGHDINLANSDPISSTALGVGMGVNVIPLLSAAPCLPPDDDGGGCYPNAARGGGKVSSGIQFWQSQQQFSNSNNNNSSMKKSNASPPNLDDNSAVLLQGGGGGGGGVIGGGGMMMSSSSMATCQDCGNQAKKDCPHRRCRTCCKSRGFDCATHVKSTWVPAARRRERQQLSTGAGGGGGAGGSSASTSGAKKPRLVTASQTTTTSHTSTSNTTPSRSFDTTSSHQDAGVMRESLPGQVRAPAVFRCVRVTAVEDGEDEYAYQAVVKIGGHVFKGVLYNQGPETSSSTRDGTFPNLSELHLGGGGGGGGGGSSSSPIMDPSDVYGGGASGGLRGGSTYGHPMN